MGLDEVEHDHDSQDKATTASSMPDVGLSKQLAAALAALPYDQRQAVVLHQLEELSFGEIAEVVGCSRSAAKVRAHRGYQQLRTLLQQAGVNHES